MLCWKRAGFYSPTDKQKSTQNKKESVTLQRNNRLKSLRKKSSKDKKDSLTITFTSNLKVKY